MKLIFQLLIWLVLFVGLFPEQSVAQDVSKLVEKAGFKSLKLGMQLEDALYSVRRGDIRVVKPEEMYRFERSELNSIGAYPIESVTIQFRDRALAEIKLHIEGAENISGILEAVKLAYGLPKAVPFQNTDSLSFQGNKVFVWLPQEINDPNDGTRKTKVNAVLCTVTSYRWDGGAVILDYNIFAADHYSLSFATMQIYDEEMMGHIRRNSSNFVRYQRASEDLK